MRANAESWERALPLILIFLIIVFSPVVYDLAQAVATTAGWE